MKFLIDFGQEGPVPEGADNESQVSGLIEDRFSGDKNIFSFDPPIIENACDWLSLITNAQRDGVGNISPVKQVLHIASKEFVLGQVSDFFKMTIDCKYRHILIDNKNSGIKRIKYFVDKIIFRKRPGKLHSFTDRKSTRLNSSH